MGLTLYQINNGLVLPVADARLYELLSSGAAGIVQGVEVTSLGGNQLQVSSGWGIALGRVFSVEAETVSAEVSASGEVDGRLLIHIDVSADDAPISFVTQAQTPLPALVQEDINQSGTIYELPLTTYKINELAISSLTTIAPVAGTPAIYTYKCTPKVDAWTGSDEAGWTQTVALAPYDGGPAVTDGMQLGPPMYLPTGVQATDEALAEVCGAINGGTSTPGAGNVALKVWEKPTADADIYFYGKAGAQT